MRMISVRLRMSLLLSSALVLLIKTVQAQSGQRASQPARFGDRTLLIDPQAAAMTYWALGSREMVGVEFLHNVGKVLAGGYFLFAAVKFRDCHGGPGRAIVLY